MEIRLDNGKEMRGALMGYNGLYLLVYSSDCMSVEIRLEQACSIRISCCPQHSVTLHAETFEMRKCLLAFSLAKPR
jgi:hypothetical protein